MMRAGRYSVLMLLWLAALASMLSCGESSVSNDVDANDGSPRIVSLLPTATGLLAALDLSDFLVARAAWDPLADDALPVVMTDSLSLEAMIVARPTHLILTEDSLRQNATLQQWADEGRFVLVVGDYPHASAEVLTWIDTLGAAFDRVSESRELKREIQDDLDAVQAATAMDLLDESRPQVLALFAVDPPMAAGPGTLIDALIRNAGGQHALPNGGLSIQLDHEGLVAADADVILLLLPDAPTEVLDEQLAVWKELELRAVQSGRVHLLNASDVVIPHANLGRLARTFAQAIHPQATIPMTPPQAAMTTPEPDQTP